MVRLGALQGWLGLNANPRSLARGRDPCVEYDDPVANVSAIPHLLVAPLQYTIRNGRTSPTLRVNGSAGSEGQVNPQELEVAVVLS
jgi:hypothetical protein